MSNLRYLKILNPILALFFFVTIKTVLLYKFSPIETLQGSEMLYKIHEIAGIIFFLLAILHLFLNWNWVKTQIFGIKPQKLTK